jgi:hypothetical protein
MLNVAPLPVIPPQARPVPAPEPRALDADRAAALAEALSAAVASLPAPADLIGLMAAAYESGCADTRAWLRAKQ